MFIKMENNYTNWLVPLNIALQLKGVGFDEICVCYGRIVYNKISNKKYIPYVSHNSYSKLKGIKNSEHINDDITFGISIPTWEQVFEWFRDKGLHSHIEYTCDNNLFKINIIGVLLKTGESNFASYEQAREALVKKLINIYKK